VQERKLNKNGQKQIVFSLFSIVNENGSSMESDQAIVITWLFVPKREPVKSVRGGTKG